MAKMNETYKHLSEKKLKPYRDEATAAWKKYKVALAAYDGLKNNISIGKKE